MTKVCTHVRQGVDWLTDGPKHFFPTKELHCVCVCVYVCVSVCVSVCECVFIFFVSLLKMFVNQIYFIVKDSFSYSFLRNLLAKIMHFTIFLQNGHLVLGFMLMYGTHI